MTTWYLRIEAVNFDRYIYDTNDLSTIRGASYAVADVIELVNNVISLTPGTASVEPISKGASIGFFRFDADSSDAVLAAVRLALRGSGLSTPPRGLRGVLPHCTFVVDALQSDDALAARDRLQARNRWQQITSSTLVYPAVSSLNGALCSEDRLRPAFGEAVEGTEHGPFSTSTATRREYGRFDNKKHFAGVRLGVSAPGDWSEIRMSDDFQSLTQHLDASHPLRDRMAVIHADGNSFGALFGEIAERARTEAAKSGADPETAAVTQLQKLDQELRQSQRDLMARLVEVCRSNENAQLVQFEPLVWAGDEFTIVVPAWRAWETLSEIFRARVPVSSPYGPFPMAYGAGVVLCQHKTPVSGVIHLAHELAEHAKKFIKVSATEDRPAEHLQGFAYEVLDSFDHIGGDLTGYRERRRGSVDERDLIIAGTDNLGNRLQSAATTIAEVGDRLSRTSVVRIANALRDGEDVTRGFLQDLIQRTESEMDEGFAHSERPSQLLEISLGRSYWLHLSELLPHIRAAQSQFLLDAEGGP